MKDYVGDGGNPGIDRVAFIGNYAPRRCGIATFTQDLSQAVSKVERGPACFVVPMTDDGGPYRYPKQVHFQIAEADPVAYVQAADYLNVLDIDAVSLQHEFGIFGGADGRFILQLMQRLRMPVVTTMHTVVRNPADGLRETAVRVAELSDRIVVMAERGRDMLQDIYGVDPAKIDVIPHGIPNVPFIDPNFYKEEFDVEGRLMMLTFGLLSPNKGIENAIRALPEVVRKHPEVVYVVLGATHPNLLRSEGEIYREGLQELAESLAVSRHLVFHNRFVSLAELKRFIGAADIYVTPYLNEEQITSGALAYAFGAGKPVVSTPYWHAQDLLANGRGVLVPFGDSDILASELNALIENDRGRHAMRRAAYRKGREMIWSRVAEQYIECFQRARSPKATGTTRVSERAGDMRSLPKAKLDHVRRMTDSTGIWQHARFGVPRFEDGYCTDDNARALLLTVMLDEADEPGAETADLQTVYLAFLNAAFDHESGRFKNFLSFDRRWLEEGPDPKIATAGRSGGSATAPHTV